MEIEQFKQHFITFIVPIRSKHIFDIDWLVQKISKKKSDLTEFSPARFFLTTADLSPVL